MDKICEYQKRIKASIDDYMLSPVSERLAVAVKEMADCWLALNKMSEKMCNYTSETAEFTKEDAEKWNAKMQNDDGTVGGHWTVEQTTAVAESIGVEFEHITDYCWNVAMNMMYSDYHNVADNFGVSVPKFYADMAKAFLFDKDGGSPKSKLSAYYHSIVE